MPIQREHQVVTMDTMQGETDGKVLMPVALDDLQQRSSLAVGEIVKSYRLASGGYLIVELLEQRHQFLDEGIALTVYLFSCLRHLFLPYLQHQRVRDRCTPLRLLQQDIPLLVCIVISGKGIDIGTVVLGDDHIHQSTALLTASLYQQGVRGGHHHQRDEPDMLGESLVLLLVPLEVLLLSPLHAAGDELGVLRVLRVLRVLPFYHKERLVMADHLRVYRVRGRTTE